MDSISDFTLHKEVLDILPTPVLIKDSNLRYIFINKAFEDLFQVERSYILGELDRDVFKDRQVSQCNGGDLRVIETGEVDEAYETVFDKKLQEREVITRKNRLKLANGDIYLVGTIHDITDVSIMNRQLVDNEVKLKSQSKQLELIANTDPLTGCNNRRALDLKLPELFENNGYQGGLLAIDIDHFKKVNDTYGHNVGDLVLSQMVRIISSVLAPEYELVRMGGEEFVVACAGLTSNEVFTLAEKLRAQIELYDHSFSGHKLSITVSIGVAHSDALSEWDLDKFINIADKALYQAKKLGRNQVA